MASPPSSPAAAGVSASRSPRVLIIDDSTDFRMLARQFIQVEWPDSTVADFDPVERGAPPEDFPWTDYDVVLLDYRLGADDGLAWLQRFRRLPNMPPIVFLTGSGNEDIAVQALKAGASDYIRKHDLSRARLASAIAQSIAERAERNNRITQRLDDPHWLTGVQWPGESLTATARHLDGSAAPIHINGYQVLQKIGEGGMSSVYLSQRWRDNERVVLKILDASMSKDNEFLKRFIREYGIISKMNSPWVVKIFDQGFTDEHVYIAMEYFAGGDLKARIDKGLFPWEAVGTTARIVRALEAIHNAGVVHRDLKPTNIMFRDDGTLGILDFGIAKLVSEETALTKHGQVFGTPFYMSPEQGAGRQVDRRSDIYSAGVIFYEMLTGQRLYTADNALTLVYQHIHDPIPRLPKPLAVYQPLLDRICAKNPNERFQTAAAVLSYLRDSLGVDLETA